VTKKHQKVAMLATCQPRQADTSGRHEEMSSKLTFEDIKNVEISGKWRITPESFSNLLVMFGFKYKWV
jgi:hypothetical protein